MRNRIKQLQEFYHMNQLTFANATGIGNATLSNIYNGKTNPTLKHVELITEKFPAVNLEWLMRGTGQMFNGESAVTGDAVDATASATEVPSSGEGNSSEFANDQASYGMNNASNNMDAPGNSMPTHPTPPADLFAAANYGDARSHANQTPENRVQHASSKYDKMAEATNRQMQGRTAQGSMPRMEMIQAPLPPQRKITEIRIFYDDQTWESFVPKK